MAFQLNNNTNAAQSNGNNQANDNWKAQGFLNFYLPSKDGGQKKLGAIPLRVSKPFEKQLLDMIAAEGEEAVLTKLLDKIILNYQSAEVDPDNGFDL